MAVREEDLFMSVRLHNSARICNVLISSQTTGQDVIECLKPEDDKVYYLVEIWKGCERPISHEEKLQSVLLQWGSDVEDVSYMLKEKLSRKNNPQKKLQSPHNSPVQLPDQVHDQQMKVESMERELQEKEKYLQVLRIKEAAKNSLKSSYVRRLELKVLEQEEQLKHLQTFEKELFKYQVENEKLVLELHRVRSMFALKQQHLAEASARIELLTRELSLKRRGDILDIALGVALQDGRNDQEKTKFLQNESQHQRYKADQTDSQPDQKHYPGEQNAPLTEKQILRLKDHMLRNKLAVDPTKQASSAKNGFLKHVISPENDDVNSLLSWRDDEENDTETSADSGHVSVDSPLFHTEGMGPSFYFNGHTPDKHMASVEHFDMDQELPQTQERNSKTELGNVNILQVTKDSRGSSALDVLAHHPQNFLPPTKHRSGKAAVHHGTCNGEVYQADYKKPLFVQTDNERGAIHSQYPRPQTKHDSPHSTSSLSSQSSELPVPNGEHARSASPKSSERGRTIVRSSKDPGNEPPKMKETKSKPDGREINPDRTAGSISVFQRRRSDCGSPTPRDRLAAQVNDPNVETPGADMVTEKRSPVKRGDSNSPTPKKRLAPWGNNPKNETPGGDTKVEKIQVGPPVPSVGVQDLLSNVPAGLKVSTRDAKAFQIQTIAEKDSEKGSQVQPETTNKPTSGRSSSKDPKLTRGGKSYSRLAPKPLPRKRAKTPPIRNSDETGNLVVTSVATTSQPLMSTPENSTIIPEDLRRQEKGLSSGSEKQVVGGGRTCEQSTGTSKVDRPGASVGESSLRRKEEGKGNKKSGKRVSLDPHAVLLHASLDGELDVIKSIIHQVEDPSFPNTEGLTALHHAVCNSHDDIVKFLIEYGCDINAADMQGWTSLHCAAANNCEEISKFLVNNGACVFAVTAIEGKTPSRCCEKDSDNFDRCFSYLSDLEDNVGISNNGVVYAVYAYQATRKDELSFECGERLTVVRRGDVTEKEWWWARDTQGQLGYIPRNLLGLCPRIAPDV